MAQMRLSESKLLGVKRAAHALGVHPNTVRNMADRGELPCELNAVGARQFRVEDLDRALTGGAAGPKR